MKLTWIEITNFQCFGSATVGIDFENDLTAFVGGNGSGKTAVMRALTRMFGVGSSQRTIRRTDFHIPPEAAGPINGTRLSIDGTFSFPTREPLMNSARDDPQLAALIASLRLETTSGIEAGCTCDEGWDERASLSRRPVAASKSCTSSAPT